MIYPGVSGRSSLLLPSITREGADPTSSVHNTFRAWLVLEACCFHTIENQDCFSLKKKKCYSEKRSTGLLGRGEVSYPWFRVHRELRAPRDVCCVRATPGDPGPRVGVVMSDMKVLMSVWELCLL